MKRTDLRTLVLNRRPFLLALVVLPITMSLAAACAPATTPSKPPQAKEAVAAVSPSPAAKEAPAPELTEAILKNGKYELRDLAAFQLVEGRYEQKYGEGATQVNRVAFQRAALGDLDSDKAADAAVILTWNSGGSGTFVNLVAVINKSGTPQQSAAEVLGDRVQVKSLSIVEGRIVVQMVGFGPTDPLCCPSQEMTRTYRLDGNTLKQAQ